MNEDRTVILVLLIVIGSVGGIYFGHRSGYQTGYAEGNSQGYSTGYALGESTGYDRGYDLGFLEGNSTGYLKGETIGYNNGYNTGYSKGEAFGYTKGYNVGSTDGYKLGNKDGYQTGYSSGFTDGYRTTGYTLRNPTYHEMLVFIDSDQTDKKTYISETYNCENFAADVKTNAFNHGYKCYYVSIDFKDSGHAIIAFDTTDKGLIYVEPQNDYVVTLKVGQHYWIFGNYYATYDDTVVRWLLIP